LSRVRVRSYAILSSVLAIAASFVYSIAVTRKLPLTDLGLLNIFTAAIAIGSVPNGISSFMSPRLAARYRSVQAAMIIISVIFGAVGIAVSGIFLFGISREIPANYYYAILMLTFLSIFSSSIGIPLSGGLTVFNRTRLVFGSIVTSIVKLIAIFYIFYSDWSLISVMVSSFLISLSGIIYVIVNARQLIKTFGRIRTTIREFASGSWVSLLGYASSNIRALDSFFIAAIGGIADNALWQVMSIMGSVYAFRGTLINITYGELLEVKSRVKEDNDDILFIPSDHFLGEEFIELVRKVKPGENEIVLFGHVPDSPSTGYGYIKPGRAVGERLSVEGFREKPDEETAEKYVNEGYLWNMGMFYMKRETGVNAFRELLPEVYRIVFEDECRGYEDLKETSFDKGIVEMYKKLSVVKYSGEWRDIGSWKSFYQVQKQVQKKDSMGNAALGNSLAVSSENSLTVSQDKLTVAYGFKGLAVIATRDATLVIPLELSEKVKDIVNMLGERVEARRSPTMYRPWGYYTILEEGPRYKVKKLFVAPGKSLSYQMHYHRAEHWVVVKGTAKVTYDDKENIVAENESFYVPMGKRHRIENPGKLPLEIIEVQTGEYLEEDDIVRL